MYPFNLFSCNEFNRVTDYSDITWSNILDHGKFDYIVVGSGCTALAFIDEALKLDNKKRILCLERGGVFCYNTLTKWHLTLYR
jgi:hypothetical protein